MARGKYNKDYRLTEEFQANGRVRTGYEYIGEPWFFCADAKTVETEKKKSLALVLAAAAAFVAALVLYSGFMHVLWIALPFAVTVIPIFMMADLSISMQKWQPPMEHRHADKLNNAFPARSLFMAYLSAISLVGEIVYSCMTGFQLVTGDIVMIGCTAVIFWCALMLFRRRASLRAETKDT